MNDTQGMPAPPPERALPNHRRIREDLMMKIDQEDEQTSLVRRWGLPLSVAAGVAALSVGAVSVFGGEGAAEPVQAGSGGSPTSAAASPGPSRGSSSAGARTTPSSAPSASAPSAVTVTSVTTTPIKAGVDRILSSCLGSDAGRFHPVIAVRTPAASKDWDGTVIAVDAAGQYVQCQTKGERGSSPDVPPTFINDRLWGTGHIVEYFDAVGQSAGKGRYVSLGAGHYTTGVAKMTVSYGEDPKQYPVVMAGGAFFYTASFSTGSSTAKLIAAMSTPYVHAYNATGKEIYNQKKDPRFTDASE